jgi:hypothetical protein
MLKQLLFIFILLATSAFSACSQQSKQSCNKVLEQSVAISYCAPTDWSVAKMEGNEYHQLKGEKHDLLTPNLIFDADQYKGTLSEYYNSNIDYLLSNYKNVPNVDSVEVESRSDFNAGEFSGFRVVLITKHKRAVVRTILYFFNGKGDTKISMTATFLQSEKDELDKVFDDTVKTLKFEK